MTEVLRIMGFIGFLFIIAFLVWLFMDLLHGYDIKKEPFWKRWWGWGKKKGKLEIEL